MSDHDIQRHWKVEVHQRLQDGAISLRLKDIEDETGMLTGLGNRAWLASERDEPPLAALPFQDTKAGWPPSLRTCVSDPAQRNRYSICPRYFGLSST